MKTPDKIYIYTVSPCDNHYSITPTDNVTDKKYEVEYIRKDTLLKWVREELGNTSILRSERIETLQKVIDKLNSM